MRTSTVNYPARTVAYIKRELKRLNKQEARSVDETYSTAHSAFRRGKIVALNCALGKLTEEVGS